MRAKGDEIIVIQHDSRRNLEEDSGRRWLWKEGSFMDDGFIKHLSVVRPERLKRVLRAVSG